MSLIDIRLEVMPSIGESVDELLKKYLKPIEANWQPSELLPASDSQEFFEDKREIRELAKAMKYDLWAVLMVDTITEEALPTYHAWLMNIEGADQNAKNGWSKWVRAWTAEKNRAGDLLNKHLYLSGRVNMREIISPQYLIYDGADIGTGHDLYRNFIYAGFQELATSVSHRRMASMSKQSANAQLGKICGTIASYEARHANAYIQFMKRIFAFDPGKAIRASRDMMRKKIVMPLRFLRETGGAIGKICTHFSDAAQRIGVYPTYDYIDMLKSLMKQWNIDRIGDLTDSAERARDYLLALPDRLKKIADHIKIREKQYEFSKVGV
jgi:acyl-[acyl-carrier-protein] desaturase